MTELYVNTESDEIGAVAQEYGAQFYKRREELSTDHATSDEFNYDFINGTRADVLVMINPVSPLTEASDIDDAVRYFTENALDSLISVREEYFQALYRNKPVNFSLGEMLPRTQDLSPIQLCCWNICVWRSSTFKDSFEKNGHAVFSGKVGFYTISKLKSIKISTEEDFLMVEVLLKMRNSDIK